MDLVGTARNPIPSDAVCGMFEASDGKKLRYARWTPGGTTRKGTICLFGGRGEFIEKYFEVIADLRRRGFAVATMDWRGQGGSVRELKNPKKGYIRDFAQYDADLLKFMMEIVLPDCPPPYFALAHSMGGHILLRNARMRNSWFERMVLVAPMIRFSRASLGASQNSVCRAMEWATMFGFGRAYVPGGEDDIWKTMAFADNALTSDRDRFDRNFYTMETAPDLALGSPTIGWVRAACRSMAEVNSAEFPTSIHVPLLFVGAGSDTVVSTRAMEELSIRLKVSSEIIIPGARHEILQENDDLRQQFWAAFDAYVPGAGI